MGKREDMKQSHILYYTLLIIDFVYKASQLPGVRIRNGKERGYETVSDVVLDIFNC